MTIASSISSPRLGHVWDREANGHCGVSSVDAAMLHLPAVQANPQARQSGPAGWIDSSEQGGA